MTAPARSARIDFMPLSTIRAPAAFRPEGCDGGTPRPRQHPAELDELAVEGGVEGPQARARPARRGLRRGLGLAHVLEPGARGGGVDQARAQRGDEPPRRGPRRGARRRRPGRRRPARPSTGCSASGRSLLPRPARRGPPRATARPGHRRRRDCGGAAKRPATRSSSLSSVPSALATTSSRPPGRSRGAKARSTSSSRGCWSRPRRRPRRPGPSGVIRAVALEKTMSTSPSSAASAAIASPSRTSRTRPSTRAPGRRHVGRGGARRARDRGR